MKNVLSLVLLALLLILVGCGRSDVDPYASIPNPLATITLEDGRVMRFILYPSCAPNTVSNFIVLAQSHFYDGSQFHRIVLNYIAQGGAEKDTTTGDAGYRIRGEFSKNGVSNSLSHTRGTISMARYLSDYDSASSQFFITQITRTDLDGLFAAFGRAADEETLAVLDSIMSVPVDTNDRPLARVGIKTITVETYGYEYKVVKIEED